MNLHDIIPPGNNAVILNENNPRPSYRTKQLPHCCKNAKPTRSPRAWIKANVWAVYVLVSTTKSSRLFLKLNDSMRQCWLNSCTGLLRFRGTGRTMAARGKHRKRSYRRPSRSKRRRGQSVAYELPKCTSCSPYIIDSYTNSILTQERHKPILPPCLQHYHTISLVSMPH